MINLKNVNYLFMIIVIALLAHSVTAKTLINAGSDWEAYKDNNGQISIQAGGEIQRVLDNGTYRKFNEVYNLSFENDALIIRGRGLTDIIPISPQSGQGNPNPPGIKKEVYIEKYGYSWKYEINITNGPNSPFDIILNFSKIPQEKSNYRFVKDDFVFGFQDANKTGHSIKLEKNKLIIGNCQGNGKCFIDPILELNATSIISDIDTAGDGSSTQLNLTIDNSRIAITRAWILHNITPIIINFPKINEYKVSSAFLNISLTEMNDPSTTIGLYNSTNVSWGENSNFVEPLTTVTVPFVSKQGLAGTNNRSNISFNILSIVGPAYRSNQSFTTLVLNNTEGVSNTFRIASKEYPEVFLRPRFYYEVNLKPNITFFNLINISNLFYRNTSSINFTSNITNGDSSNITIRVFLNGEKVNETNFTNFIQNVSTSILFIQTSINKSQNLTFQINVSDAFANTQEKNTSILISNIPPAISNVSLPTSVTTDDLNVNGSVQLIWDDDNTGSFTEKLNITLTLFINNTNYNSTTFNNYLNSSIVSFLFDKNWTLNDNLILQVLVTDGTDTTAVNSSVKQVVSPSAPSGGTAGGPGGRLSLVPVLPPELCPTKVLDDIGDRRKLELTYNSGITRIRDIRIETNKTESDVVFLSCKQGCNLFNLTKNVIPLNATSKYHLEITFIFPDNLTAETVNAVINYENIQKNCISTLEYTFIKSFFANFFKKITIPLNFIKQGLKLEMFSAILFFIISFLIALLIRYFILKYTRKDFPFRATANGVSIILFFILLFWQIALF